MKPELFVFEITIVAYKAYEYSRKGKQYRREIEVKSTHPFGFGFQDAIKSSVIQSVDQLLEELVDAEKQADLEANKEDE